MRMSDWSSDVCSSDLLVVLLQKGPAARRQVGRQRAQVAWIVFFAVRGPALHLLPDVEREGIHTLGRHVPPLARAARAQIRRHMDGETLRRTPPTEAEQQRQHEQRARKSTRLHSSQYCASRMPPSA